MICPMKFSSVTADGFDCDGESCAWWCKPASPEYDGECAIKKIAKNTGKIGAK